MSSSQDLRKESQLGIVLMIIIHWPPSECQMRTELGLMCTFIGEQLDNELPEALFFINGYLDETLVG